MSEACPKLYAFHWIRTTLLKQRKYSGGIRGDLCVVRRFADLRYYTGRYIE